MKLLKAGVILSLVVSGFTQLAMSQTFQKGYNSGYPGRSCASNLSLNRRSDPYGSAGMTMSQLIQNGASHERILDAYRREEEVLAAISKENGGDGWSPKLGELWQEYMRYTDSSRHQQTK